MAQRPRGSIVLEEGAEGPGGSVGPEGPAGAPGAGAIVFVYDNAALTNSPAPNLFLAPATADAKTAANRFPASAAAGNVRLVFHVKRASWTGTGTCSLSLYKNGLLYQSGVLQIAETDVNANVFSSLVNMTLGADFSAPGLVDDIALRMDGVAGSGGSVSFDVQTFTSNGTWTKPGSPSVGAEAVKVYVLGSGAPGGGGEGDNEDSTGGGGGGGGAMQYAATTAATYAATEPVVVGAGVAGGAPNTTGLNGNVSLFSTGGTQVVGLQGLPGDAGGVSANGGSGGTGNLGNGGDGGDGGDHVGHVDGFNGGSTNNLGGGGGGGGGTGEGPERGNGGRGGYGPSGTPGVGGTYSGGNGAAGTGGFTEWFNAGGSGGGGGGRGSPGGAAGAGGTYGAGGGGGGSGGADYDGGPGGASAQGIVIVITQINDYGTVPATIDIAVHGEIALSA